MCAIGSANGVGDCANAATIAEMHQEGFDGFVRTDAGASTNEVASLESGVDLFRPYDPAPVEAAVADGTLPVAVINRAVRDVLERHVPLPRRAAPGHAERAHSVTSPRRSRPASRSPSSRWSC